jgi:hypothetical protein
MARRVNANSPMPPIVYSAAVYPDDDELHIAPLWSCPHEHDSPGAAQQCGFDWIEAQAAGEESQGLSA